MAITAADIAALRARIESDQQAAQLRLKELSDELAALTLLERRVQQDGQEQRLLDLTPTPPQGADIPVVVPSALTLSFAGSVRKATDAFGAGIFTVADIENMMRSQGAKLPTNNLRTRIANEVKELVRKQRVLLQEKGSGHVPHKYRNAMQTIENERAHLGARSVPH